MARNKAAYKSAAEVPIRLWYCRDQGKLKESQQALKIKNKFNVFEG